MRLTYRFFRAVARLVCWLWAPMEIYHADRLPTAGPTILIANHRSLLDGFLLVAFSDRPVTFVAAAYLFRIPFVGWVVRQVAVPTGSVPGMRQTLSHLEGGGLVALFPEGGVRTTASLEGLGDSAAYLASKTGAVVVPLAIAGAADVLPLGRYRPRRRKVKLRFGEARTLPQGLKRPALLAATTEWMAEVYAAEAIL